MTNEKLRAILERITANVNVDDPLLPAAVVAAARPRNHPLHDEFEWDDEKAAHAQRLDVARSLIRRVHYHKATVNNHTVSVPVYVHLSEPGVTPERSGYVALSGIQRNTRDAGIVLDDELQRVIGALKRACAVASRVGPGELQRRLARLLAEAEAARALLAGGILEVQAS